MSSINQVNGKIYDGNRSREEFELNTVIKDFEVYLDNKPNPIFFSALNVSTSTDLDSVPIKPKIKAQSNYPFKPAIHSKPKTP